MRGRLSDRTGQLVLPMLALLFLLGLFLAGYLQWTRRVYWKMRMDVASEAAALSAARAQAQTLNKAAVLNEEMNRYIPKVSLLRNSFGVTTPERYVLLTKKKQELGNAIQDFGAFSARVGKKVAQLNGATGTSFYFPLPMRAELLPQSVHVLIVSKAPPAAIPRTVERAFYARGWKPSRAMAQPTHKTTWLAQREGVRSLATARLWLDLPSIPFLNNGGFPRPQETLLGGIGIQSHLPQFNARLAPTARLTPGGSDE